MNFQKILTGFGVAAILSCAASSAQASIIYSFVSATAAAGGLTDYKYNAQLSGDQKIVSGTNDFAVIYDFFGLVGSPTYSGINANVTLSTAIELTTMQPFAQSAPDSASMPNVRTTISGNYNPGALTTLYTIDLLSTSGNTSGLVYQSAQAVKTDGTITGNTALIAGPAATTTPEPTTLAMMGGALLGLGLWRKKVRS